MKVRSDRTHHFARSPAEVWDAIGRVDGYRSWWPWLRRLEAEGLVSGDEWHCTVQPPLPYALRFTISIDDVDEERRVTATVRGDILGTAEVTLAPSGAGCDVRLASVLEPSSRPLQVVSTLAPWMARFGHDWVISTGLGQFERGAL